MGRRDVFLSYCTKDGMMVFTAVSMFFVTMGYSVFNPTTDLSHAEKPSKALMQQWASTAGIVIVVCTAGLFQSKRCEAEIAAVKEENKKVSQKHNNNKKKKDHNSNNKMKKATTHNKENNYNHKKKKTFMSGGQEEEEEDGE